MSNAICIKCGKKGRLKKYHRPKLNSSGGNLSKRFTNKTPQWFNKRTVASDNKNLETATIDPKKKNFKWCMY